MNPDNNMKKIISIVNKVWLIILMIFIFNCMQNYMKLSAEEEKQNQIDTQWQQICEDPDGNIVDGAVLFHGSDKIYIESVSIDNDRYSKTYDIWTIDRNNNVNIVKYNVSNVYIHKISGKSYYTEGEAYTYERYGISNHTIIDLYLNQNDLEKIMFNNGGDC